jgi:hypothetical protein
MRLAALYTAAFSPSLARIWLEMGIMPPVQAAKEDLLRPAPGEGHHEDSCWGSGPTMATPAATSVAGDSTTLMGGN